MAFASAATHRSLAIASTCDSQDQQPGYQSPPPEIADLADAKPIAAISVQPRKHEKVLYMHHNPMLTLEDVSAPVLKLGGARFNPCTLVPHGAHGPNLYRHALEVQDVRTGETREVRGLPDGARIEHLSWSPDGSMMAFSVRTSEVGDDAASRLWLLDVDSATAAPAQPEQRLNAVLGTPFRWMPGSKQLLVKRPIGMHADAPTADPVPSSPSVQQSDGGGKKAAVRTYPNLLSSEADAAAFRHYATVQLVALTLAERAPTSQLGVIAREATIGDPAMTYGFSTSPDGSHLLLTSIRHDQLSTAVPWQRFGRRVEAVPLPTPSLPSSPS